MAEHIDIVPKTVGILQSVLKEILPEMHLLGSASNRILRYIHVSWSSPSELDTLYSQN